MKATILQKLLIFIKIIYSTLRISIGTIFDSYLRGPHRGLDNERLRWWASYILQSINLTFEILNPHQVKFEPGKRYIIMSNHNSHYDIPLLLMAFPSTTLRMLTKKELFRTPSWGRGLKAAEFISIDRHDHNQALKDMEHAKEKMESGITLWISRTGELLEFKKGGFFLSIQTDATIIPVGIRGTMNALPPGTLDFTLNQHAEIRIGQPVNASQYTKKEALMEAVRSQIHNLSEGKS
jgi:1-acyl-sn-glycerol-3-phosphate acyltransferase